MLFLVIEIWYSQISSQINRCLMCKRSDIEYNMTFSHLISKANNHLSIWAEKAVLKRHSLCLLQQEMRTIICFFLLPFHGSAINRGTFNQIENIVTTFVDWCNTNYHIYTPQKTNIRVLDLLSDDLVGLSFI